MKFSNLGRPIDQEFFPNVAIVVVTIITIASGTVFKVITDENISFSLIFGFLLGVNVFLTWALCREIDPDNDFSAFVQIPFTIWGMLYFEIPNRFLMLLDLMCFRTLNRTTGLKSTWFDTILWFVVGCTMVYVGDWLAGVLLGAAYILDGILSNPLRRNLYFGIAAVMFALVYLFMTGSIEFMKNVYTWQWVSAIVAAGIYLPVILNSKPPVSECDNTYDKVPFDRLKAVQVLTLAISVCYLVFVGEEGLKLTYPFWTMILGVRLFNIYKMFKKN